MPGLFLSSVYNSVATRKAVAACCKLGGLLRSPGGSAPSRLVPQGLWAAWKCSSLCRASPVAWIPAGSMSEPCPSRTCVRTCMCRGQRCVPGRPVPGEAGEGFLQGAQLPGGFPVVQGLVLPLPAFVLTQRRGRGSTGWQEDDAGPALASVAASLLCDCTHAPGKKHCPSLLVPTPPARTCGF